jgi:hypothetical protein
MSALQRNREFEDRATRELSRGLLVDVAALNAFAGRRADQGASDYRCDFPDPERDLEREVAEELADARNYLVWRLEQINRGLHDGHWKVCHLQRALRCVVLAFEETSKARRDG